MRRAASGEVRPSPHGIRVPAELAPLFFSDVQHGALIGAASHRQSVYLHLQVRVRIS